MTAETAYWAVSCADGFVWETYYSDRNDAQTALDVHGDNCDCLGPHHIVTLVVPQWITASDVTP